MKLIEHLREHGLHRLTTEFFIRVKRHTIYLNLVLLKYDSINSPLSEKVVQQSRGIILDEAKDWSLTSYPFDEFFNYGEPNAVQIDWSTAKIYEKLDGSLMVLYFNPYASEWEVSSSGIPDASGFVNAYKLTFCQLFWQTWNELKYRLPEELNYCFMFELITPYNPVIVIPKTSAIVLHGVRNLSTLKEDSPDQFAEKYGWQCVQRFNFNSWDVILAASQNLNPLELEGYIVCDDNFNRVKVKSPEYVGLAHTKGSLHPQRLLEVIVNAEGEEFLTYFHDLVPLFNGIKAKYDALVEEIVESYQAIAFIESQKDFATIARTKPYSKILFGLRSGKFSSVKEGLKSLTIGSLLSIIQI